MRAIAVDDEALALSVIEIFCKKYEDIELVSQFTNGHDAISYIDNNDVDIIFLDINMPHITGVEVAKIVAKRAMIIFTTAYQNYAVEGFELEAVDYLMKPFSFDRFKKAVDRAFELKSLREGNSDDSASHHIMIKADSALVKLEVKSIIAIEGLKDYIKIITTDRKYVTKSTMKSIESSLSGYGFVRVQKSYVVNIARIESVKGDSLIVEGGLVIPIGQQYRSCFLELFKAHTNL